MVLRYLPDSLRKWGRFPNLIAVASIALCLRGPTVGPNAISRLGYPARCRPKHEQVHRVRHRWRLERGLRLVIGPIPVRSGGGADRFSPPCNLPFRISGNAPGIVSRIIVQNVHPAVLTSQVSTNNVPPGASPRWYYERDTGKFVLYNAVYPVAGIFSVDVSSRGYCGGWS